MNPLFHPLDGRARALDVKPADEKSSVSGPAPGGSLRLDRLPGPERRDGHVELVQH
jgi:hypothetical protein